MQSNSHVNGQTTLACRQLGITAGTARKIEILKEKRFVTENVAE